MMKQIQNKLRSKSGASMLIALVFMLFCLFVGGAVLAAASVNGYRAAHQSDQQDFLSQRSACLLLADEIDGASGLNRRLVVNDVYQEYKPIIILDGGGTVEDNSRSPKKIRTITFTAPFTSTAPMTVVQRVMYETAVCRYLEENSINLDPSTNGGVAITIVCNDFWHGSSKLEFSQFWYQYIHGEADIGGSIDIQGKVGTGVNVSEFDSYTANFSCGGGEDDLYDFTVDFGSFSQMTVSANAFSGSTEIVLPGEHYTDAAGNWEVTSRNLKSTISWKDAYIGKGGA